MYWDGVGAVGRVTRKEEEEEDAEEEQRTTVKEDGLEEDLLDTIEGSQRANGRKERQTSTTDRQTRTGRYSPDAPYLPV